LHYDTSSFFIAELPHINSKLIDWGILYPIEHLLDLSDTHSVRNVLREIFSVSRSKHTTGNNCSVS